MSIVIKANKADPNDLVHPPEQLEATVEALPPPIAADVTRLPSLNKGHLVTISQDRSQVSLNLSPAEKESRRDKEAREALEQDLDDIWEKAKELVSDKGAVSLAINFSKLYISYKVIDADGAQRTHRIGMEDPQLKNHKEIHTLMQRIRDNSKILWDHFEHAAPLPHPDSRPQNGRKPFAIETQKWTQKHPRTLEQFAHVDSLKLASRLPVDKRAAAQSAIQRTETYIQKLQTSTRKMIQDKRTQDTSRFNAAQLQAREQTIANLQELHAQLEAIDRYPVYWAVGLYDENIPPYEMADTISLSVQNALQAKLRP